jgi:DNA-binding CsgD family transcriptional regulator
MADPNDDKPPAGLSEREYAIAQEMVFGGKPQSIAVKLNLNRSSVWEAMHRPHVIEYVQRVQREVREANERLIVSSVGVAIATLAEIASDRRKPDSVRVSAAGHLLRSGLAQRHEVSGPEGAPIPVQTTHILDGAEPKDVQELVAELRRKRLTG